MGRGQRTQEMEPDEPPPQRAPPARTDFKGKLRSKVPARANEPITYENDDYMGGLPAAQATGYAYSYRLKTVRRAAPGGKYEVGMDPHAPRRSRALTQVLNTTNRTTRVKTRHDFSEGPDVQAFQRARPSSRMKKRRRPPPSY